MDIEKERLAATLRLLKNDLDLMEANSDDYILPVLICSNQAFKEQMKLFPKRYIRPDDLLSVPDAVALVASEDLPTKVQHFPVPAKSGLSVENIRFIIRETFRIHYAEFFIEMDSGSIVDAPLPKSKANETAKSKAKANENFRDLRDQFFEGKMGGVLKVVTTYGRGFKCTLTRVKGGSLAVQSISLRESNKYHYIQPEKDAQQKPMHEILLSAHLGATTVRKALESSEDRHEIDHRGRLRNGNVLGSIQLVPVNDNKFNKSYKLSEGQLYKNISSVQEGRNCRKVKMRAFSAQIRLASVDDQSAIVASLVECRLMLLHAREEKNNREKEKRDLHHLRGVTRG
jgi:hypothetical protein